MRQNRPFLCTTVCFLLESPGLGCLPSPRTAFILFFLFLFLSQLCLFWDYYAGTEHGPCKSSALLPGLDASKEKSLSHLSLHQSTLAPLILHQKTPSWPQALLGSDPKAQGEASWPFPAPIPFCTQTPGSLVGSSTAAFALCLLNFSFPLPLNPIKPEPTLSLHRFALPSLQVVLAQGSTLPKYTGGKSGETALISLGFHGYKWELRG